MDTISTVGGNHRYFGGYHQCSKGYSVLWCGGTFLLPFALLIATVGIFFKIAISTNTKLFIYRFSVPRCARHDLCWVRLPDDISEEVWLQLCRIQHDYCIGRDSMGNARQCLGLQCCRWQSWPWQSQDQHQKVSCICELKWFATISKRICYNALRFRNNIMMSLDDFETKLRQLVRISKQYFDELWRFRNETNTIG